MRDVVIDRRLSGRILANDIFFLRYDQDPEVSIGININVAKLWFDNYHKPRVVV